MMLKHLCKVEDFERKSEGGRPLFLVMYEAHCFWRSEFAPSARCPIRLFTKYNMSLADKPVCSIFTTQYTPIIARPNPNAQSSKKNYT